MRVKVGFEESSKAITAHVTVEGENITELCHIDIIEEQAKKLFESCQRYAAHKTMQTK